MSRTPEAGTETDRLRRFRDTVTRELLQDIAPFWVQRSVDHQHGGFVGRMTNDLRIIPDAPKGVVLNARILWAFAALYRKQGDSVYRELADRAFAYLVEHFVDRDYGGVYWLLDAQGRALDTTKKIYGQAFAIYALSEYYAAVREQEALRLAMEIFDLAQQHNFDPTHGGYLEASSRDWGATDELRLSERDLNERKSMNTHLHLLEAYTRLYQVSGRREVGEALRHLLRCFIEHIADPQTGHWVLFFDDQWRPRSHAVSFGHEIEGSWLLVEAAAEVDEPDLRNRCRAMAVDLAEATLTQGMAEDFGIYAERRESQAPVRTLQWWQQAEAVVGFLNAYQMTGQHRFLEAALRCWEFIERYVLDRQYGEWFYELLPDRSPNWEMFKICEWKGPYHNTRMCLEVIDRVSSLANGEENRR
ncbi:MAG: AGE family epimerase/isomerase [candidate division KSB1 bacterium]|nr:AGE family epimerase/isomerase [candidate division KSB1 bacterium]